MLQQLIEFLPQEHQKHLLPDAPKPMRMMAAKGMAPLPPREMILVMCGLSLDQEDTKLAGAASKSLAELPDEIVLPVLAGEFPVEGMTILAPLMVMRDNIALQLVMRRELSDSIVATIAASCSESVVELIATNQERCLRSAEIIDALRQNPHTLKSTVERVFDFLVREGVVYDQMPESGEAMARLNPEELEAAADKITLPDDCSTLFADSAASNVRAEENTAIFEENQATTTAPSVATPVQGAQPDTKSTSAKETEDGAVVASHKSEVKKRIPVMKLIANLSVSQKVALALKGNKEARSLLIREKNKLVSTAVIRSPRITAQEVLAAAKSRQIAEDVIRVVANDKQMHRPYAVKLALVGNPKCPQHVAFRFLTLLRDADLKSLAKSKNISSAVQGQALRISKKRKG